MCHKIILWQHNFCLKMILWHILGWILRQYQWIWALDHKDPKTEEVQQYSTTAGIYLFTTAPAIPTTSRCASAGSYGPSSMTRVINSSQCHRSAQQISEQHAFKHCKTQRISTIWPRRSYMLSECSCCLHCHSTIHRHRYRRHCRPATQQHKSDFA